MRARPLPRLVARPLLTTLAVLALLTLSCATALAQEAIAKDSIAPEKRAAIKRLLEANGTAAMGKQAAGVITRQLVGILRKSRPDIPVKTLDVIERETTALVIENVDAPGGLLERMYPLYDKAFTLADLETFVAFFQSPAGRKYVAAMPGIMLSGEKIGAQMAKDLAPVIRERLKNVLARDGVVLDKLPN